MSAWAGVASLVCATCDCSEQPRPSPSAGAQRVPPRLTLLAPGWTDWSAAEALERLADEKLGISAAVRLVRLTDIEPLCAPVALTDATVARLRLVRLAEDLWALGLTDRSSANVLHAPALIGPDGGVELVADGTEEEALTLHVSPDAEVFPHLLISPRRVLIAAAPPQLALTLQSPPIIGFARREQSGYGYVALLWHGETSWREVARYEWQPYELAFAGPASDKLPDPSDGKFVLDMDQSPLLIPVGGEIPEPTPRLPPEEYRVPWDEA